MKTSYYNFNRKINRHLQNGENFYHCIQNRNNQYNDDKEEDFSVNINEQNGHKNISTNINNDMSISTNINNDTNISTNINDDTNINININDNKNINDDYNFNIDDIDLDNDSYSIWEKRETCYMSLNKQGGKIWRSLRIGCIQASLISEICERTFHSEKFPKKSLEELAEITCGLSKLSYSNTQELAMSDGIIGEPLVRNWFSKDIIKKPIYEVGVAIWKKDIYFRNSLDGETENENSEPAGVEIKVPKELNKKYIEIAQSWGKNLNNPHPESYIYRNHYDQMTAGNVITGKKGGYYVVACLNSGQAFYQYLETDYDLWEKTLYPKAKAFHNKYVMPLIIKHNIQVIFPPNMEVKEEED